MKQELTQQVTLLSQKPQEQPETWIVYSDGASRGNPGPAGAGWVICHQQGKQLAAGNLYLGICTNNEAEYMAALLGMQAAQELGLKNLVLRADSELMIRQLQGRYRVKHPRIVPLYERLKQLVARCTKFTPEHVPRAQNAAADEQANVAIDQHKNR